MMGLLRRVFTRGKQSEPAVYRPARAQDVPSINSIQTGFDSIRADYSAAKQNRFKRNRVGVNGIGRNADYHYRQEIDFLRMLETARDIDRNDAMVGPGIDTLRKNVIKTGMKLEPETGDPDLNTELKQRFEEWGKDPDRVSLAGTHDWKSMERLAFRSMILDGDIFLLPHVSGAFESVESHRVRTPPRDKRNITHGVHLGVHGRPIEYFITKRDIAPLASIKPSDAERRRAVDSLGFPEVIHLFDPKRFSQTRGVTALHRVIDLSGQYDDLQFAKLVQAQVVSYFAIFRKREAGFDGGLSAAKGERSTDTSNGYTRTHEKIGPGMMIDGEEGEDLTGFSPNTPNETFFPFAKLILTGIAVNLGLPLCVFLLDASETNFSGFRGAVDQAREGFTELQNVMTSRFHRSVYRWKVRQWLGDDQDFGRRALEGDVDIYAHRWQAPAWKYLEPVKDATAAILVGSNMLNSPRRIHAEQGRNYQEVVTETVEDLTHRYRTARDAARTVNSESEDESEKVTWRELLPMTDGLEIKINASEPEPQPQPSGRNDAESSD